MGSRAAGLDKEDCKPRVLTTVSGVVCSEARTWKAMWASGVSRLVCSQPRDVLTRIRSMDHSAEGAAASAEVPQELLEEMLWYFRSEDGR